ncbi:MAG TPA: TIGR00730 family Rossman fold protein [Acidimicrobiales bacterium]|nr:TIGR00730 family Rossman fold protein [Acidimicrobiales bacterium]
MTNEGPAPSRKRRRATTGNTEWDRRIDDLLDEIAPHQNRDLLRQVFLEGVRLATIDTERLDLKIASAALREMRQAFAAFAPVRGRRKLTVFGSARTQESDPLYVQARELARIAAERGWMAVTGAGPGIMLAAMEGAGRENSFGVRIRLPFEADANEIISGDTKLVSMKYFFTRKLMLMKESSAFVAMPGGFGTLDETVELITLQQTGKSVPVPVVLLDVPGGDYWQAWQRFVVDHVAARGYVNQADLGLVHLCDDHNEALAYIDWYYANYRSLRWFGDRLVIRLNRAPDESELAALNSRFASMTTDGKGLVVTGPHPSETAGGDELDAERVELVLDPYRIAELHLLIGALNELVAGPVQSSESSEI